VYWAATGRLTDALREAQAAQQLDPLSTGPSNVLALVYFFRGEYDRSMLQWNKSLEMTPNSSVAHLNLFDVYRAKSMYDKAVAELVQALRLEGQSQRASAIDKGFQEGGFRGAMLARIRSMERTGAASDGWYPVDIAESYLLLGNRARVFVWLDKAYKAHSALLYLKVDPVWDPIRSDPRYADLLNRMGLAK
jgi:tetratricopeptide (TPR) repeat protein